MFSVMVTPEYWITHLGSNPSKKKTEQMSLLSYIPSLFFNPADSLLSQRSDMLSSSCTVKKTPSFNLTISDTVDFQQFHYKELCFLVEIPIFKNIVVFSFLTL